MKNKTRHVPANYVLHNDNGYACSYILRCSAENPDGVCLLLSFIGKQSNSAHHYRFKTYDDATAYADKFLDRVMHNMGFLKQRRADARVQYLKAVKDLSVGQLFAYSWGYDQTNVDFFQVTRKSRGAFWVRPIQGKIAEKTTGNGMSCYLKPISNSFTGEEVQKTSFSMAHGSLCPTTETENHYNSWYA